MGLVDLEVKDYIAVVTLNNPRFNIMTRELMREFAEVMKGVDMRNDVRVVLLRSACPDFCAGADVNYVRGLGDYQNKNQAELQAEMDLGGNMFASIYNCRFPVVIAAQGRMIGGGAVLACCADVRIAAEGTVFCMAEINVGWIGASAFMEVLVPRRLARYYMFTGHPITAEEVRSYGGLLDVVPMERLEERAMEVCKEIARFSPLGVQYFKAAMNKNDDERFAEKFACEYEYSMRHCRTEDFKEAIDAFFEKRKPEFKGR